MSMAEKVASRRKEITGPFDRSAIWTGALAALAAGLVFGLGGIVLQAHPLGAAPSEDWQEIRFVAAMASVLGAFFAGIIGGWAAGKMLEPRDAMPTILNGAMAWLLTVPLLLLPAGLVAGGEVGRWYAGLGGAPMWVTMTVLGLDPEVASIVTAPLVGLVGTVVGGWMTLGGSVELAQQRTGVAVRRGYLS